MTLKKLAVKIRRCTGLWMLRVGANLSFKTKEEKEEFKNRINSDTWFGSFIYTGNHLCGSVQPMNEFDTQSVINVLSQKTPNYEMITSEKEEYYKENWLAEGDHKKYKQET